MKKLMLGTAIAVLASSVATAQDYQFEVGAKYVTGELEVFNSDEDYDGYGLNFRAHLDRVDTSKGPLNEAAFLDKSSHVDLAWETSEFDVSGAESDDTITLSGRFVTQESLIIEASVADEEDNNFNADDTFMSLGFGTYLNDNMDVVVTYGTYDDSDENSLSAKLHGFNALEGQTSLAYDLGLGYIIDDGSDESGYSINAGADYYLDKALSFGAGIELESADNDISTFDVRANYFVTPVVRLGLSYMMLGQDADGDALKLNAAMRF